MLAKPLESIKILKQRRLGSNCGRGRGDSSPPEVPWKKEIDSMYYVCIQNALSGLAVCVDMLRSEIAKGDAQ